MTYSCYVPRNSSARSELLTRPSWDSPQELLHAAREERARERLERTAAHDWASGEGHE